MTPYTHRDIADAWNSVTDLWIVRRNTSRAVRQWEIVHDWGGDLISDDTQKIVGLFKSKEAAEWRAEFLEQYARAEAVIQMLEKFR
jgi:hypothetical protein